MPYNIVLVSAIHQYKLVMAVHVSPRSLTSSYPATRPAPPGYLRASALSWPCHTAHSSWLCSLVYGDVYVSVLLCQFVPPFLPPLCPQACVLHVCFSIAALKIGSSVPSFYIPLICINVCYFFFFFWLTSL